ncbi:unnamed protein product, partial [marine sediment metagenome]
MVWFDADYGYKKKIEIDHTKVGGDETDFPVLVSVTDGDLADEGNSGHVKHASGYDIIFTNDDEDTQLKHEIELYTNTDGTLVFWVKILSLSSTSTTTFYIYYGKTGVIADPSTTDTWDANYVMVQHMTGTGNIIDSTSYNNDGTENGTSNEVDGKIGKAREFDGSTDYFTIASVGGSSLDFKGGTSFTFESWIYPDIIGADDSIISRFAASGHRQYHFEIQSAN